MKGAFHAPQVAGVRKLHRCCSDDFLILVVVQTRVETVTMCLLSSAVDSRTGTKVAIKKLYRPFQSELFAKRAYRELRLLKHMKHENVSHHTWAL